MEGYALGTYTSIFNASLLLYSWEQGELGAAWRRLPGRRAGSPATA